MEKQVQERKKRAANGAMTSKMMCIRIDAENVECLKDMPNKNRLINTLLARYFESDEYKTYFKGKGFA